MAVSGSTLANIGKAFGVTQQAVSRWLADARAKVVKDVQRDLAGRLESRRTNCPTWRDCLKATWTSVFRAFSARAGAEPARVYCRPGGFAWTDRFSDSGDWSRGR